MILSIIIVNYNTKDCLVRCLESLKKGCKPKAREIIVVDNGSRNGSVEEIKKEKLKRKNENLKLKIILNRKNLGFAKANNQGIRKARGKYILLLNSDTIVEEGQLEKLLEFAERHPEAGVIGPKLILPSGETQASCRNLPTIKRAILEYWLGKKGSYDFFIPGTKKAVEVESVTGAAMLVPQKVLEKTGLLDERYFMYFEDLDFCQRVKRSGFKIYYFPDVEIFHHHGASGEKLGGKPKQWLFKSSEIYHGAARHFLINAIIWSGQKWGKLIGK
jgi:GT2 family glycosyltransferase